MKMRLGLDCAQSKKRFQRHWVWTACLAQLSEDITSQSLKTWFEPIIPVTLSGGTLMVQVPSQFFYDWIEEHYEAKIRSTIMRVLGNAVTYDNMHPDRAPGGKPRTIDYFLRS